MTEKPKSTGAAVAPGTAELREITDLNDPRLYVNRELGLLEFQRRVLEEAQDADNPLLERVKFLAIVSSNLNEFFMVRVAGLLDQIHAGVVEGADGEMTPAEQMVAIREVVIELLDESRRCLRDELVPALAEHGIEVVTYEELSGQERAAINSYFRDHVYPVLTPLAFDPGRPFPHISNLSLNLAVQICDDNGIEHFARVKAPDTLPQLVAALPSGVRDADSRTPWQRTRFVWLEQLIAANLDMLFPGMRVVDAHPFHVTRDADIEIQELEAEDLLETVEESVRKRRFGSVVRLVVHVDMPDSILGILMNNLQVEERDVYRVNGPLALNRLMDLCALDRPLLKYTAFLPRTPKGLEGKNDDEDIFAAIRRENIVLHHPFESFQPVVNFLRRAAADPQVLAIKMTLYRVGRDSPVVEALLEAMQRGKQVAVLVELKARFDEESNIEWARALEREGVHVVYGLVGLKIHCKVALVVRREGQAIRRYVHMSTGNYNAVTAHLYTDLGYFTCDKDLGADATDLFNYLTGYSAKKDYRKLLVAPINMREEIERLIENEIEHQESGRRGHLILKTNALVDTPIIRLLYRASQAGVKVDLLVRGICCLRPGIPGLSDNIRVISIVGRFLEHSRIYYFHNDGGEQIYIGSADLMPRNLNVRVETVFPVEDAHLKHRIRYEILESHLADNVKARRMLSDGTYVRVRPAPGDTSVNAQEWFLGRWPRGS